MFSEALRILDRNTAELMVDRMKDEIVDLKEQNDELTGKIDELQQKIEEQDSLKGQNAELQAGNTALKDVFNEKDAEIARLKKLLEEQNK